MKKKSQSPKSITTVSRPDCVLVAEVRDFETHYPAQVTVYRTYNSKTSIAEHQVVVKCASPGCSRCCSLLTYLPYCPGSVARAKLVAGLFLACDELAKVPLDIEPRGGQNRLM